jgi:glycosyltransferase involved in cell wall biosynthesis
MQRTWDIRKDKPLVSACVITYNHAPYIRESLDGILMQATDFPFEVIVHDDASTDGTAKIVREYAEKYPEIIIPVFQTENQYSKGISVSPAYVWPRARGEYQALCEGDDYWTDPLKLQRQVDALRSHPECTVCLHAATYVHQETGETGRISPRKGNGLIEVETLIDLDASSYATASIMRRSLPVDVMGILKELYGRHSMVILYASFGGIYYIDQVMCHYRMAVPGSWSTRNNNIVSAKQHAIRMTSVFYVLDQYTKGRFRRPIRRQQVLRLLRYLGAYGYQKTFSQGDRLVLAKCLPATWRTLVALCECSPRLAKLILRIWREVEKITSLKIKRNRKVKETGI